ncbi:ABC-2 type transport system ATP-binding protein [Desulfocicer vacuolatum DSM 3385]|uniref:ABC-2 type transport system ATP-binding protein n=1 Tax=Desulfocicer vacuolatum DSM 3385 TaxID=1121400 RepID=A0A1W1YI22_9BACT|nr:ATP-binding cassette domain-containing protein [Desulfocicer vacuolatum]SMC35451.1 ABC-2 type transport system ATP-binding protein [Desulfocicer vacuolatum DSM 3385]
MIQVNNLTKYYDSFCAVDGISLEIRQGEILGLLGPNGAGKTTTLRMLTGFFKPTSGTIKIDDLEIPKDTLEIKKRMGYLPESAPLYHNMLVFDYLTYVAKVRGLAKEDIPGRLQELSGLCGLADIMHKSIDALSKGLKQRVGLAHAMMTDPEILILDEPTSGLDPNQIAEIRAIIRRIGKKKTIIFSTHILSEAEATCDRIVIINQGKMVADDTTENLKHRAEKGTTFSLALYGETGKAPIKLLNTLDADLDIRQVAARETGTSLYEVKTGSSRDFRKDIYLKIKETDWVMAELTRESQSLENIFQELTKGA